MCSLKGKRKQRQNNENIAYTKGTTSTIGLSCALIYIVILSKSHNYLFAMFTQGHKSKIHGLNNYQKISLTRQSLCNVFISAVYVSESKYNPSCMSCKKSKSLKVGLDFSLSFLDALLLYVEPFKS